MSGLIISFLRKMPRCFGQFPIDEWHERMGGGTQADSIMDRIVHNAYEIPSSETNLRKLYESKKLKKLVDEIES